MADVGSEIAIPLESEVKSKLNIIYIDDEPEMAMLFKISMKSAGGHIVTVFNSQADFDNFWKDIKPDEMPDIVVSDMNLTRRTDNREGLIILTSVKNKDPKVKTVILSANAYLLKDLDLPDVDLKISKPYSPSDLGKKLLELVNEK